MLRCINYLEQPSKGPSPSGSFGGCPILYPKEIKARHQSAMVFQSYNLFKI